MKTMTDTRELLSALIDGEAVDTDTVAAVLEVPANRALLVDFLRLRRSVQTEDETVPEWRADRFGAVETTRFGQTRTGLRAAAVLALLTAGALGGTWVEGFLTRERPPEPTRVVQLELVHER
jgi:hypothetical protein